MSEVLGLDVSHYQGRIDWKQVKAAGRQFAIMKCMYEAQSHRKDETFEQNYREAGIYGLSRGVYIFIASASIGDPEGDAKALLAHLNGRPLEYGIWLDFEAQVLRNQGKDKIRQMAYIYKDIFNAAGYYVGIYCNKDWYENVIHKDLKRDFDFWIARYPRNDDGVYKPTSSLKPKYERVVAWQYSSKGHVPGINGNVDLDVDYDGVVKLIAQEPRWKTNEEIAKEVWAGKWGSAKTKPSRRELLTLAGYDYDAIQKIVNNMKR